MNARLLLASASPRRRELLAQLGVDFSTVTAAVTEHEEPSTDPRHMVAHNAALKADWVAARHPQDFVLGADTTVCLDNQVLNKPVDLAEARTMLRRLSGHTHQVYTGLALRQVATGAVIDRIAVSEVTFKPLSESVITEYLTKVHTLDKAGGYAIQEHGELIIAAHRGSLSNIIGLPLEETKQILTAAGLLPDSPVSPPA